MLRASIEGDLCSIDGASSLLIPILICFADQIRGARGRWGKGGRACGPGAQPRTGGFVYSYEENTKCINLSIYLHVFLKGSLPEIYPLGKMLLVAGRHQSLYIKNKEKRKKRKMFLKRSYIFCYFCCFIFLNYVLNLFSV